MKTAIEIGFLASTIFILSGCGTLENISDKLYTAEVTTEIGADGIPHNVTNYVARPNVKATVALGGQIAPQPIGGFVSSAVLGLLSIFGLVKSRQFKRAAVDAVEFGQAVKAELSKSDLKEQLQSIKNSQKILQKSNGTFGIIRNILNKI
tara:strand:- start:14033 stop:14482 length:450 start_codon:yes stop_codon:yes gene_type:complete